MFNYIKNILNKIYVKLFSIKITNQSIDVSLSSFYAMVLFLKSLMPNSIIRFQHLLK
ncbi:hypothetical protein MTsPCn9_28510 [Croceitalea sp. MTPC9]|nr:hypothetical protein MTsPCn6_30000 [Croceitalea sp. MTPC6]GMN17911.1 hypothetical protein MTsPCn9_28510 [Croceitalea sp. MTPC9]